MGRKTKMNKLTDADSLAAVCIENRRLVDDYINYLMSTQKSPTTIAVYKNDLDICMVWCVKYNGNKFFVNWSKRDIIALQNWLINDNGNSPARVRRIKAVLSSMSNYIESILDDEYPNFRNIIHKVESPIAQPVREKTVLTDEQIDDLLKRLSSRNEHEKACMLALAVHSGRRKSELVRFRVDDFKNENLVCDGALYKTTDKIKTKGFGCGKFIYCYTLAKDFKPYFDRWMEQRDKDGIKSEWLFPHKDNPSQQMKSETLNSWAVTFSKMLGADFYWHCLRHAFCTRLVRAGLPDGVIQEIVGWSSADMVKVYTDIDSEEQIGMWFKNGEICTDNRGSLK